MIRKATHGIVVGAGPNGLAAAITLARAGLEVQVLEAAEVPGGGLRSEELTLPGFIHDVCATVLALGSASPFIRSVPLEQHGVSWVHPPTPLAHPFDGGRAVLLERSVDATSARLGRDRYAYQRLFGRLAQRVDLLTPDLLGPMRFPRHPIVAARFGALAALPATSLARAIFVEDAARALFAGMAAHSMLPLTRPISAAVGLVLGAYAHAVGFPFVRGGSQRLADALVAHLRELGGQIVSGTSVRSIDELDARALLLDLTPRQMLQIAGDRFPAHYRRSLRRYRYGPGVFKIDWALDGPIPWRAKECCLAGTVHLGGTLEEIARAEADVHAGRNPEQPFVLLTQPSLFDPSRAPAGEQVAWAYCHVPNGSTVDMTERIEAQVERFAPGFRGRILARHVMNPAAMQRHDANYIGGDINGGIQDLSQLFTRPVPRWDPYSTPDDRIFICSSSTPPGGGVHGMCGANAAQSALRRLGFSPPVPSSPRGRGDRSAVAGVDTETCPASAC